MVFLKPPKNYASVPHMTENKTESKFLVYGDSKQAWFQSKWNNETDRPNSPER